MRKNHLLIGVLACSLALSFNANADIASDLANGQSPFQAATYAAASGKNPSQIRQGLVDSGVPASVASMLAAMAPNPAGRGSVNALESGGFSEDGFFGFSLINSIMRIISMYSPQFGQGGLLVIIAIINVGPPPGPSPS